MVQLGQWKVHVLLAYLGLAWLRFNLTRLTTKQLRAERNTWERCVIQGALMSKTCCVRVNTTHTKNVWICQCVSVVGVSLSTFFPIGTLQVYVQILKKVNWYCHKFTVGFNYGKVNLKYFPSTREDRLPLGHINPESEIRFYTSQWSLVELVDRIKKRIYAGQGER